MDAIADEPEPTNVEIARALSRAASIRSGDSNITAWMQTEPRTLTEAIAEATTLGTEILGRARHNPLQIPVAPATLDVQLLELARFNAAVLIVADFLNAKPRPVSSAELSFGVRSKAADVYESFVGLERAMTLLAGMVPLAVNLEAGLGGASDRDRAHVITVRVLEWTLAEYCAVARVQEAHVMAKVA